MVTSIFVVEPITEPTLRVGKKVLKNYNHHSQQEHLPERKSTRLAAASTSPSSSPSPSPSATVAKTIISGKLSPEKARYISSSSSTVSQDDQTLSQSQDQHQAQDQSLHKAQEKKTTNYCETSRTSSAPVRDVAANPKTAPATSAPTRIIKHNLLLGPTLMRQKRQQKRKERQAKADAVEQQLLQEERRSKEIERKMVKSGLVSNMSNLQKTLARVSTMKKKPPRKVMDDASKNLSDDSQGRKSCSNDTEDSRLTMTDQDKYDTVPENDVYTFDTKPRSRWISASYFTEQHRSKDLFKYSNIQSLVFTDDSDSHDHLTSECQKQQTRSQTVLPKGFTKWLQQKVAVDKEEQHQLSLIRPEKAAQRTVTVSMMNMPDKETSDHENEVVKRGRGRPRGSTNKKKQVSAGSTAEREVERPKINIFEPKNYSCDTKEELESYPGRADRDDQTISRSVISEPTSPEERHELAKQLLARFEADDKRKKRPLVVDDDYDDDNDSGSMNFRPFDFGDEDDRSNNSKDYSVGRSSDDSTKHCHITENGKRQKMDPSTAVADNNQAGIIPNRVEDLSKPNITTRPLLELAAGMARGHAVDLFYKRGIALDALMEAKGTPATTAALQYVKRLFGGAEVVPLVFKAIDDAEVRTLLSMKSTLAFYMMSPPIQGGLGWDLADTENALLGLQPLLGSNLGLDPIDSMSLVTLGLTVGQALSIEPILKKMVDDVVEEAVLLHSKMVGVSSL